MSLFMMNIGFGNFVNTDRVISILDPDSAPMKRLREEAKQSKKLINATYGRRTRSIVITDSNHIILSALQPETVINRLSAYQKRENS
jgi:extracellular matrix regulatory protein A